MLQKLHVLWTGLPQTVLKIRTIKMLLAWQWSFGHRTHSGITLMIPMNQKSPATILSQLLKDVWSPCGSGTSPNVGLSGHLLMLRSCLDKTIFIFLPAVMSPTTKVLDNFFWSFVLPVPYCPQPSFNWEWSPWLTFLGILSLELSPLSSFIMGLTLSSTWAF